MTQILAWAALALFVYFLLTRLRTLAVLVGTRLGLHEEAAVRIRLSRILVEASATGAILVVWAADAFGNGVLDWEVGGPGSPLHLELKGVWLVGGSLLVAVGIGAMTALAGFFAFARAEELQEWFPRPEGKRPPTLRLPLMNPDVVFVARRRSPLLWAWTEVRTAASGVLATLALEALDEELPGDGWGETIDEAGADYDLDEHRAREKGALSWRGLIALLHAGSARPSADPRFSGLPPVRLPTFGFTVGALFGVSERAMEDRRRKRQRRFLMGFDELTNIRLILMETPGTVASIYADTDLDGLLHAARGGVLDDLRGGLSGRQNRQLSKACRRDGMEGAAAWMVEHVPTYPELFRRKVRLELDRQDRLVDSIVDKVSASDPNLPPGAITST